MDTSELGKNESRAMDAKWANKWIDSLMNEWWLMIDERWTEHELTRNQIFLTKIKLKRGLLGVACHLKCNNHTNPMYSWKA